MADLKNTKEFSLLTAIFLLITYETFLWIIYWNYFIYRCRWRPFVHINLATYFGAPPYSNESPNSLGFHPTFRSFLTQWSRTPPANSN